MLLTSPAVASRSCDDCAAWMWDERTGKQATRAGRPVPRPKGLKTPCWECPKTAHLPAAERTRENAVDLSPRNCRAYRYWQLSRQDVTGLLPRDMTTLETLAIIDQVITDHQQSTHNSLLLQLLLWRK